MGRCRLGVPHELGTVLIVCRASHYALDAQYPVSSSPQSYETEIIVIIPIL